jgi:hypothetical protein
VSTSHRECLCTFKSISFQRNPFQAKKEHFPSRVFISSVTVRFESFLDSNSIQCVVGVSRTAAVCVPWAGSLLTLIVSFAPSAMHDMPLHRVLSLLDRYGLLDEWARLLCAHSAGTTAQARPQGPNTPSDAPLPADPDDIALLDAVAALGRPGKRGR